MHGTLLPQFAISTTMVLVCVLIHGLGLFSLSRLLRGERNVERMKRINPLSPRGALFTLTIVMAIIALHGIEIWTFAVAYSLIGAVGSFENALYFSTISYSTVGYNDTHILPDWRLLGAFEAILGMILIGWSTAFFFRMLDRIDAH